MKKVIYIVGIIALIAAIMVMPAAAFEPGECDIYVHDGESIMETIKSASPGDTICVYNGTYALPSGTFKIWLDKANLTLQGEGADKVTLDGSGDGTPIDVGHDGSGAVPAPGCVVEGFRIINSSGGITVTEKAPNCIIRNNVIEGVPAPIGTFASNTTIKGNIFNGMSAYIQFAEGLEHLTFIDNVVSNSTKTYASTKVYAANSVIANNTFINNVAGLGLYNVPATNITVARNNLISSGAGIKLYNAPSGNKIYLNNIVDNTENVVIGGSGTPINFWNSTEPIEYVCPTDDNTYTDYLGNYWSDHPGGAEDGCGIWATPYGIPPGSPVDYDYRPLMAGYENYIGEPAGPEPTPTPTPPTPTPAVFDTGHGTYPSIRGTHTGTFTPNQTMVVNRMYTYPCVGTGGHTESVRFYGPGGVEVTKTWNGYHGDYHGIEFGADAPTLQAGTAYNYMIVTGSYPQIIHNETLTTPDGTINCTEFVDANEKRYTDWIPAIRLESGT